MRAFSLPLIESGRLGLDELARLVRRRCRRVVIFGLFGSAVSSFSSRTQLDATRVDSSACAAVSKKPTEVMTPSPASIEG